MQRGVSHTAKVLHSWRIWSQISWSGFGCTQKQCMALYRNSNFWLPMESGLNRNIHGYSLPGLLGCENAVASHTSYMLGVSRSEVYRKVWSGRRMHDAAQAAVTIGCCSLSIAARCDILRHPSICSNHLQPHIAIIAEARDVMSSFQPKPETENVRSLFLSFLRSVSWMQES